MKNLTEQKELHVDENMTNWQEYQKQLKAEKQQGVRKKLLGIASSLAVQRRDVKGNLSRVVVFYVGTDLFTGNSYASPKSLNIQVQIARSRLYQNEI